VRVWRAWVRVALALVVFEILFVVVVTVRDRGAHSDATAPRLAGSSGPPPTSRPTPGVASTAPPLSPQASAAAAHRITVADASAFDYEGMWEHISGRRDGRTAGRSSRTYKRGARATLTFTGSYVRLYGVVGPGGGYGAARIDRAAAGTVDFFAATKATHRLVFQRNGLSAGTHRLSLTVIADPTVARARSQYVNIDGAEYGP
jgi:hypothetical protein